MKVCFVETTNASPHLETSLELARNHLLMGDEVEYHFVGYSVPYSEFVGRSPVKKLLKAFPESKGAELLASELFCFVRPKDIKRYIELPDFNSIEELRKYEYKNYRAGLSALSSLISFTRTSSPSLSEFNQVLKDILISGISVYEYCMEVFSGAQPSIVYLFNGRFANNRAILDAAQSLNIKPLFHERGANQNRYYVKPFAPHNLPRIKEEMTAAWSARTQDAEFIASKYFLNKRSGVPVDWPSFISDQQSGYLPTNLAKVKRLVSYFSSSDDEYASVDDYYKWSSWPSQLCAVRSLIDIVSSHPSVQLVIRLHPRKAHIDSAELDQWLSLDLPSNCSLVHPSDKIDTYALIEESDLVVTSGSTVGIEAVFWNTPSICLGPSLYTHLDAVYLPETEHELEELLLRPSHDVEPKKAYPYGYYMSTHGELFEHYKSNDLFSGSFLGVNLQSYGFYALIAKIKTLLRKYLKTSSLAHFVR